MLVSFIIPVYKAEKYLKDCVASLLSQTMQDFEIILVDDGSPDNSPELCDSLAKDNSKIRVLHKLNGGAASARNLGIKAACGEYVIFVDADDFWIFNDYLSKLIIIANNYSDCDFINFNCSYYYDSTDTYRNFTPYSPKLLKPVDKDTAINELVASGTMPMSPCVKLIKRSYLINNGIFFPEGTIMEDVPWFVNLLCKSTKILFLNDFSYAYRQDVPTSVTHTINLKGLDNSLTIIERGVEQIKNYNLLLESQSALLSFYAYEVCILLASYDKLEKAQKIRLKNLLWLFKFKKNPKVKIVANLKHIFGLSITILFLKLYLWYRERR